MKVIEQKEWGIKCSKYFIIPHRYILSIMACLAIVCGYMMRVCLSIAMTQIVLPINKNSSSGEEQCPKPNVTKGVNTGTIDWDEQMQATIFSSFYLGYIVTQVPAGILSDKFGAKWILGIGVLVTTIGTVLCPLTIDRVSSEGLITLRVIMGLGSGPLFPATSVLLSHWIPVSERGKVGTVVFGGCQFGTVLANGVSGILLERYHWSVIFYLFSGLSFAWFFGYILLCYSDPQTHPFIKPSEREFLINELVAVDHDNLPPLPIKEIFKCASTYALLVGQIGHDWGYYIMVTYLPKYLNDVLNIDIASNGLFSALPYIVMYISSIITGVVTDYLLFKRHFDITAVRKFNTFVGAIGPAVFIILASYAGCDKNLVITYFTVAMGLMGIYYAGLRLTPIDMSPNYAGFLTAISNGAASLAGIFAPYMAGLMTPNGTLTEWRNVFWLAFGVMVGSASFFVLLGSGEIQDYNEPNSMQEKKAERKRKREEAKQQKAEAKAKKAEEKRQKRLAANVK